MNIEFIKSEFEKLTLILRSWKEDHNISAIERDIVLDKLKNIYDAVRFADADTAGTDMADSHTAVQAAHNRQSLLPQRLPRPLRRPMPTAIPRTKRRSKVTKWR